MAISFIVGSGVASGKFAYIMSLDDTNISVITALPTSIISSTPKAVVVGGDGKWYVGSDTKIAKLTNAGALVTTWATNGIYTSLATTSIRGLAVDNSNYLLFCHPIVSSVAVGLISSSGAIIATNSINFWDAGERVAFAADGTMYLGMQDSGGGQPHCFKYTSALATSDTFASYSGSNAGCKFLAVNGSECIYIFINASSGGGRMDSYDFSTLTAIYQANEVTYTIHNGILHSNGDIYCGGSREIIRYNSATGVVTSIYTTNINVYGLCELSNGYIVAVGGITTNQDGVLANINIVTPSLDFVCGDSAISATLYSVSGNSYTPLSITLTDKVYTKSLIAIGAEQVWHESSTGVMSEITAARGTISTESPLTITQAFQKIFIANDEIFKVIDKATIKLSTAEIGASSVSVPIHAAVLSGQTSGAGMICDYVDAATGSAYVYGYQMGATAFSSGEIVLDVGAAASVSFALLSTEASAPHVYNWTQYANDSTNYGSLPGRAYIVCRYRGRLVLAGHPNYPHQWYASKIADPYDWVYGAADPLSAVAGNNADAGELGDIIRALIPYGDDFLVFGCAGSIHILNGDPASGGSIDEIDNSTGVFSPWSWCKDGNGNLYFYGNNGIYRMAGGRSRPELISIAKLPKLKNDWAVDPSAHRVTLSYDSERNSVLIIKTTIADGTNEAYWYNIDLDGFYPCTFPSECGVYSVCNYNADDPDYRKTIFGCKDGYIKYLDDSVVDDNTGVASAAISAHVTLPIESLSGDEDIEGKLTSLTFVNAGGAITGAYGDSDGFRYELYRGDDAETVLEDIKDGATPFISGVITTPGRQTKKRDKVRTNYLGIRLINDNAGETFAIDKIVGDVKPAGKVK